MKQNKAKAKQNRAARNEAEQNEADESEAKRSNAKRNEATGAPNSWCSVFCLRAGKFHRTHASIALSSE